MKRIKKIIIFLVLCPLHLNAADIKSKNNDYPFLAQGFDITFYQKCKDLIAKFPVDHFYHDKLLISKVSRTQKVCNQLENISQTFAVIPAAKQVKAFTIFDLYHSGDSQHEYYILSKVNLLATAVDPRTLNTDLAKKYNKTSFFIVNWSEPQYYVNVDGSQKFTVVLKITESCLACPIIGWATLGFNFTKEGVLRGIELERFQEETRDPV
jgi:hypothetical protein